MTDRTGDILTMVRQKLQSDGIKLWLPPYYIEGLGECDDEIERLAATFGRELAIQADRCRMALAELQHHAVSKRRANEAFATHGIATIKVRAPVGTNGARFVTVETRLSVSGREFQQQIAQLLDMDARNMRVINAGRFVHENETLESQGVRNHHQVMVVAMSAPATTLATDQDDAAGAAGGPSAASFATASAVADENIYQKVARARADAEMLTNSRHDYMEMEDQSGNTVHLPPDERRAIMIALALHEKGKAALKREQFSEALVWLLEADEEYKRCASSLLQSVDNWALLNLDVVWCYLCLKSVAQLPEAEQRLYICERSFKRSYGDNLDRVVLLKGNAANERALIMRLHLLQAVIMYHQNRRPEAATMLQLAAGELERLHVSEASLMALVEMGYEVVESRCALRACGGSVDEAITYIMRQRDERAAARRAGRAENRLRVGRSKDKAWVNPRSLNTLVEMGFEQALCEVALRKTDNDVQRAVQMLQTDGDELRRQFEADFVPDPSATDALVAMGFDRQMAEEALRSVGNNVDGAMDELVRLVEDGGVEGEEYRQLVADMAAASTTASEEEKLEAAKRLADRAERDQAKQEAFDRLAEDIDDTDDDHLDLALVQEANVLAEYRRFLDM